MEIQGISKLIAAGIILAVTLISPLFFIAFDFWAGIRKAKERKEVISSDGWQRTVAKISKYYNALLALLVIDALQMSLLWYIDTYHGYNMPVLPFLTFVGAVFIGAIEVKSIYESADDKVKKQTRDVAAVIVDILKNKQNPEEIAKSIAEYLNGNKEKEVTGENK